MKNLKIIERGRKMRAAQAAMESFLRSLRDAGKIRQR